METFTGKVIEGVKVGGPFGLATANLELAVLPELEFGVYVVEVTKSTQKFQGVMHLGALLTFGRGVSCEVHILNFSDQIYGEAITVTPLKFLRPTQKFPNADLLFSAIARDIVMTEKFFAREKIKAKWSECSVDEINSKVTKTIKKIQEIPSWNKAQNILVYVPGKYEIPFLASLMEVSPHHYFWAPKVVENQLLWGRVRDLKKDLVVGAFGILEPIEASLVVFGLADICLVPGVAADARGNRLGRGGGFYDQFLPSFPGQKIMIIPQFAWLDSVPVEPHDVSVDRVIVV